MKTNLEITADQRKAIETYLYLNEKFAKSFFWNSPSAASSRRSYEEKNSFKYSDDRFELSFNVSCSCKNIYVTKSVKIDGKTTNATSLKKFVK